MTRMRRIYTDFLVLVPLTQRNEKTAGERDQHPIREDPYDPCHPCAIAQTRVSMRTSSYSFTIYNYPFTIHH